MKRITAIVINTLLKNHWSYLFRLFGLLFKLAPLEVADGILMMTFTGLMPVISLYALQHLIDVVVSMANGNTNETALFGWIVAMIGAMVFQEITNIYGTGIVDHIQERVKLKIQHTVLAKAQALPLATFDGAALYDHLQRVQKGLDERFFSTMNFSFRLISQTISIVSLGFYLGTIHWLIPAILSLGTIVFSLVRIRLWTEKYLLARKQSAKERRLNYFEELMTGRKASSEVRLFGLGNHLLNQWFQLHRTLRKERLSIVHRQFQFDLVCSIGFTVTLGCALIFVIYFASQGMISVGEYAAFIGAVLSFQQAVQGLLWNVTIIHHDLFYIEDLFTYMDLKEEVATKHKGNRALSALSGMLQDIIFENVTFIYPGSKEPVVKDVNLHINGGDRIALVGDNGSGKTTLVKLMLGLYRPTKGRILVNGIDLEQLNIIDWRDRTTAIFQDFQKYEATVRDNIAMGNIKKKNENKKIIEAAQLSGAIDLINKLPCQYDTFLGKEYSNGFELSQGQWQKIAIARAYFRDSDLLVLDEPTAALDPKAEVDIYKQFQNALKGKTALLISHRLGIARLADRIIVLNNGKITEQGDHYSLMEQHGYYAQAFDTQRRWYN